MPQLPSDRATTVNRQRVRSVASKDPQPSAREEWAPFLNLLLGLALIGLAWPASYSGFFPILGVLVAAFAPTIFLGGVFLVALGLARVLTNSKVSAGLLIAALLVAVGLNSRLLSLFQDITNVDANEMHVATRFDGVVGQPIHIASEVSELSARRFPYAHAAPACSGDGCLATEGFRTPFPGVNYWREDVTNVVLAAGFSKANAGDTAPTLRISQGRDGRFSNIEIQLTSADGQLLSRYAGKYRNGHRYETVDGVESDSPSLVVEYLLHGNPLNAIAASLAPNGEVYPLASFLKRATNLSHPQGSLRSRSWGSPPIGDAPSPVKVELEILEEKTYEPKWVIKGDRESGNVEWSKISYDKDRAKRCDTLIVPETRNTPLTQTWHLFVADPSGRKKARYTGNAFCDDDAIWFLDYVIDKGRMTVIKYSTTGDLFYQVSFAKPNELSGFAGSMMGPTFKAENGYVRFEWWNTYQSGWDRQVARSMRVQFMEPRTN